jgi:ubiquinone/menaquinone biosynthesis C-methylase UbiE
VFVRSSADRLAAVAGDSVDAVTARSVLIYVADKPACFREFHRVYARWQAERVRADQRLRFPDR